VGAGLQGQQERYNVQKNAETRGHGGSKLSTSGVPTGRGPAFVQTDQSRVYPAEKIVAQARAFTGTEDNLFGESPDLRREMAEKGEPNFLNHLDVTWSNLTQGLFATNPKDDQACQYCDFRIACRRNAESEVGE
jgi:hypothetical protein